MLRPSNRAEVIGEITDFIKMERRAYNISRISGGKFQISKDRVKKVNETRKINIQNEVKVQKQQKEIKVKEVVNLQNGEYDKMVTGNRLNCLIPILHQHFNSAPCWN